MTDTKPVSINLTTGQIDQRGLREIGEELRAIGVRSRDLSRALRRAARPALMRAKAAAPVNRRKGWRDHRAGNLQRSIKVNVSKTTMRLSANAKDSHGRSYAAVVHWGRDGRSGPQFIKHAVDDHQTELQAAIRDEVAKLFKEKGY